MKKKENLVWDNHNIELIGYVNLSNIDLNHATLSKVTKVAPNIPVFLIRSIVNSFKFTLANFAADGISAPQLCRLFWKAISICEKFIAVVCSSVCPNFKLFQMHCHLIKNDGMNPEAGLTYRTHNLFSGTESRFVKNCAKLFTKFWQWYIYTLHVEWWILFAMEPYC